MTRIELELHDDIITTINKIRNINDTGVELFIPERSVLFENVLNLKIIDKFSQNLGINVVFNTDDDNGANLIEIMNDETKTQTLLESSEGEETPDTAVERTKFNIPKISIPKIKFPKVGFVLIILVILGAIISGGFVAQTKLVSAYVKIAVDSQPLTRGLTIKVMANETTNLEKKVLQGKTASGEVEEFAEIETTGEKIVGEKAEGKIIIYNNTDDEKKINSGTILKNDDDREFEIVETVIIDPREQLPPDPSDPSIVSYEKGEEEARIRAVDIGEEYNTDDNEEFEIDDYKKSELVGVAEGDVDGGKSEKIKTVAQEDIDKLKEQILEQSKEPLEAALKRSVESGMVLINGSETTNIIKETLSHELDEETDKISLTQSIQIQGLTYVRTEVEDLANKLMVDLVPEGYELSQKDTEINVEILGNSSSSTLSEVEADIQVTIKTFVIAQVNEESLKERLAGKNVQEAEKIVKEIQNVKTYSLEVKPDIKVFNKLPSNKELIYITVEKD